MEREVGEGGRIEEGSLKRFNAVGTMVSVEVVVSESASVWPGCTTRRERKSCCRRLEIYRENTLQYQVV